MEHIVVNFRPFSLEQEIMVYANGVCIENIKISIDKVVDAILSYQQKYNIDKINLCGNPSYLSKFKAELGLRFSKAEINIIPR